VGAWGHMDAAYGSGPNCTALGPKLNY
jgi:hypothetical protein